jgi:hypothetical protein
MPILHNQYLTFSPQHTPKLVKDTHLDALPFFETGENFA